MFVNPSKKRNNSLLLYLHRNSPVLCFLLNMDYLKYNAGVMHTMNRKILNSHCIIEIALIAAVIFQQATYVTIKAQNESEKHTGLSQNNKSTRNTRQKFSKKRTLFFLSRRIDGGASHKGWHMWDGSKQLRNYHVFVGGLR